MGASKVELARRALVTLLVHFGLAYAVAISVNRDSPDAEVLRAFRRIALKVHPDKPGGGKVDFQKLNAARETWDSAQHQTAAAPRVRPCSK